MRFANPGGYDLKSNYNLDGWGIIQITFDIVYTLLILTLCGILWKQRDHPIIRMRKISMAITAVLVLHVYLFLVLFVYPLNGRIGLFQAQNQQLFLISRGQQALLTQDNYKPIPGGRTFWQCDWNKFVIRCKKSKDQDAFEGYIAVGMVVQFLSSLVIYLISRKFNSYGIVSEHTTPALCRRGWEWAPSIIWQATWNFVAGPYLLWKIRAIRDIYNWRLQTSLAILAGLPGTPLWLVAVYSDKINGISKYWNPAMWFLPGLIIMQTVTIISPLCEVYKGRKRVQILNQDLKDFDKKQRNSMAGANVSVTTTSTKTKGSGSSRVPIKSMEDCLQDNGLEWLAFFHFCTTKTFNGENLAFLDRTNKFKAEWRRMVTLRKGTYNNPRLQMFRTAVHIYLTLIWKTAKYPINIPCHISRDLAGLFQEAATIVVATSPPIARSASNVTPWDEPADPFNGGDHPLRPMLPYSSIRGSTIDSITELDLVALEDSSDPLTGYHVPVVFDDRCFDAAYDSIKHMMWEQPYQDFIKSRRSCATSTSA
ncbi:MAG: hypothetical protein Q9182_006719 [Xanthomendoza sp. 2 TL-2023]